MPRSRFLNDARVLILAKAYPPVTGGVETYSEQLAIAYARAGMSPIVITQTPEKKGLNDRSYGNLTIPVLNVGGGGQLSAAWGFLRASRKIHKRDRVSFIHSTTWRPAIIATLMHTRTKSVITVHGNEIMRANGFFARLMWFTLKRSALVVFVSTHTKSKARKKLGGRFSRVKNIVSPNGLTFNPVHKIDTASSREGKSIRLLTVARLVPRKNIINAIRAADIVARKTGKDIEYRIVGSGSQLESLRQAIADRGRQEKFVLLGRISDEEVQANYQWADIFMHPQIELNDGRDFEGFGISVADAMAHECLAIAGSGPGPAEFIVDGQTGFLVDGNNLDAIVDSLMLAVVNETVRKSVARNGREYVSRTLSWDEHVKRILDRLTERDASSA